MEFTVTAPDGYEASVVYIDGARSWQVFARKTGATFWTKVGPLFGHPHLDKAEIVNQARVELTRAITLGLV